MNATVEHRLPCYGDMFPDFRRLKFKEKLQASAFVAQVMSSGTGPDGRVLETNQDAWERCVRCSDYRTCYDLSLAKLLMHDILMNTMVANPWVG